MDSLLVHLFAEDQAHEEFLKYLVRRLAAEELASVTLRVISARGGHGRAISEFSIYQRMLGSEVLPAPDIIVVAIDANCSGWNQHRNELKRNVKGCYRRLVVAACPDPHVERWYLADARSFEQVVGVAPQQERRKCERDRYKRLLQEALQRAGHMPNLGGIEFARELVDAMDLYQAGQAEPSLRAFVDECRDLLQRPVTRTGS